MKSIILAGGYGTRLGSLTKSCPKPMLDIAGKPCLERIVEHLEKFNINQIMVNVHYRPLDIMQHFGSRLLYSYEPELYGEEGTIASLRHWIKDDYCLVVNGDTLTNLDIHRMVRMSKEENCKFMDGKTYAGYRLIKPGYIEGDPSVKYQDSTAWWVDIGSKRGLKKARKLYG